MQLLHGVSVCCWYYCLGKFNSAVELIMFTNCLFLIPRYSCFAKYAYSNEINFIF